MTMREALGGPWATHWALWASLFVPATLIIGLRESVTGFDSWLWILLSAVLQHLAVGVIILGGGALARRRRPLLPLTVVAVLWAAAAIARGIVGGVIAQSVTGADPEFIERSLLWLLGTVVWVPLIVYTVAQIDRRRLLLGALDATTANIEKERARADESGDEVRRSLNTAVRESLQPSLGELVTSLELTRDRLGASALAELSLRVSQLHDRTADLLEPSRSASPNQTPMRSSVRRAFDVPPRLPWVIAGLTALSTTAMLMPEVWRVFGSLAALELVVSIAVASLIIGLVPWIVIRFAPDSRWARDQRATVLACTAGMVAAVYLMLNSGIDPITTNGLTVLPLLMFALVTACVVLVGAVVLAVANRDASEALSEKSRQLALERKVHDAVVDRERLRLAELMHGPVQGRLAACIMALNFTATSTSADNDAGLGVDTSLVDSVLDHLRAVSRDLTSIATADLPSSP